MKNLFQTHINKNDLDLKQDFQIINQSFNPSKLILL